MSRAIKDQNLIHGKMRTPRRKMWKKNVYSTLAHRPLNAVFILMK
jgi:hypothetical protein